MSSFRIVSLPREMNSGNRALDEITIKNYVEHVCGYGSPSGFTFIDGVTGNGIPFKSVIVDMAPSAPWTKASKQLALGGRGGIIIPSHYVQSGKVVQFHFDNGKPMKHIKHVLIEPKTIITIPKAEIGTDMDIQLDVGPILGKNISLQRENEELRAEIVTLKAKLAAFEAGKETA